MRARLTGYLARVWKGAITHSVEAVEIEGAIHVISVERRGDRVVMTVKADGLELELPMADDKAWLLGGRLMDEAHIASGERAGEVS
jgi:hypothetical protein